ncbi:hypothetical protein [Embleya scabrispora]|uniref:hypothetical protein n=1 Tax=Embleya scabrispora TaxID=159449 RepID=UPI00117DE3BA|nr:hypothetical protein [Embleya scabrispora]
MEKALGDLVTGPGVIAHRTRRWGPHDRELTLLEARIDISDPAPGKPRRLLIWDQVSLWRCGTADARRHVARPHDLLSVAVPAPERIAFAVRTLLTGLPVGSSRADDTPLPSTIALSHDLRDAIADGDLEHDPAARLATYAATPRPGAIGPDGSASTSPTTTS